MQVEHAATPIDWVMLSNTVQHDKQQYVNYVDCWSASTQHAIGTARQSRWCHASLPFPLTNDNSNNDGNMLT